MGDYCWWRNTPQSRFIKCSTHWRNINPSIAREIATIIYFKLTIVSWLATCKAFTKEGVIAISLNSYACIKANGQFLKHENRRQEKPRSISHSKPFPPKNIWI
jgi:hypothetical protein